MYARDHDAGGTRCTMYRSDGSLIIGTMHKCHDVVSCESRAPRSRGMGSGETGDGVTGMNYNLEELAAKRDGSSGG